MNQYERFLEVAEKNAFDPDHKSAAKVEEQKTLSNLSMVNQFFSNIELARTRAAAIRKKTIENLEKYLIEFESEFNKRGGKIIWAQNDKEAGAEIAKIATKRNIKSVYIGSSELSNEIKLEHALNREKITIFGHEPFLLSVADAQFIVADTGALITMSNDNKEQKVLQQTATQIYLSSIDRILPQFGDIDLFTTLYSTYAHGKLSQNYTTLISGPKQSIENYGPQELFLVLIDNGRTELLSHPEQRLSLSCINCKACHHICPVYKLAGEKAYESFSSGPIGSVTMPYLNQEDDYKHLSYASTLCGKCKDVCPVNIDIPRMLQFNRKDFVDSGAVSKKENISVYFWRNAMLKRSAMDKGQKIKNFMMKQFFRKDWGNRRVFPETAPKSFNQMWREKKGIK